MARMPEPQRHVPVPGPSGDPVVEAVRADLLARSRAGLLKYGVPLAREDLNLRDWLQHAYEETLDQANYLKCAIMALDREAEQSCP